MKTISLILIALNLASLSGVEASWYEKGYDAYDPQNNWNTCRYQGSPKGFDGKPLNKYDYRNSRG